ncbi:MAG: hypothetical protein KBG09_04625 [Syntrophobacterales bacterium]|nr:hypothetical protein [Syntrophobacterales bacterium]
MAAITTSVFELLKIGPGPSSSHTMGLMKAGKDSPLEILGRCFLSVGNPTGDGIPGLPMNSGISGLLPIPTNPLLTSPEISHSSPKI